MSKAITAWNIACLSKAASQTDCVAQWHHDECLNQGLESTYACRRERLSKHLLLQPAPRTWVALSGDILCGCVSLVSYQATAQQATDWDARSPLWLSNLYVPEKFRRAGIGQSLVEEALAYVKSLQQREVWLMATNKASFYQKRDWSIVREAQVAGRQVNVMRKILSL